MKAHFILYVPDQRRAADFYTAVLNVRPEVDVPGMTEFRLNDGCLLGLMPETSASQLLAREIRTADLGNNPRAEIYLVVVDPAEFHARSLAAGATEISPLHARDWGHEAAYSMDPSGHVLAFAREIE